MRKLLISGAVSLALVASQGAGAQAPSSPRFDIQRFEVTGNSLLSSAQLKALLDPFTGPQRDFADVQRALDALEGAYRVEGYGTVQVRLPEQEVSAGVLTLAVTEVRLGQVSVVGLRHYSQANVLRALPALQPGTPPNLRRISEGVQLSNESRSKQVEVTLADGAAPGTVDARVQVDDESPHRFSASLDNTGLPSSGRWRTGFYYQHENLFDRDQAASLAYTTSPDSPSGVHVSIYGLGYRLPLYAWGDSIDFLYGRSSSNTPSSTPSLGGALNLVGMGEVAGIHFNHNFARAGETSRKLILGIDRTHVDSRCTTVDGNPVSTAGPTPPIASCVPYTLMPLKIGFASSTRGAWQWDYSADVSTNLASGARYTNLGGPSDRYSYLTAGNRDTHDQFSVVHAGSSLMGSLPGDWQFRLAASGQLASAPLVSAASFGLTGAYAVRGFDERALSADSGLLLNAEVYTQDLVAARAAGGSLRGVFFIDAAHGINRSPNALVQARMSPASAGVGVRASLDKTWSLRLDVASVLNPAHAPDVRCGDVKAHLLLSASL